MESTESRWLKASKKVMATCRRVATPTAALECVGACEGLHVEREQLSEEGGAVDGREGDGEEEGDLDDAFAHVGVAADVLEVDQLGREVHEDEADLVGQLGEVAVLHQQEEVKEHVQVGRPVVCVEQTTDGDYLQVGFEEELLADGGGETQDDDAEETQQDGLVVGVGSQILSFISFLETHLEVVGDEVDEDDGGVLETLRLLDDVSHELQ